MSKIILTCPNCDNTELSEIDDLLLYCEDCDSELDFHLCDYLVTEV